MTRWIWGAGAAWAVTVILGASLAWLAIDRAGSQVTTSTAVTAPATGSAVISAPTTAPATREPAGRPTKAPNDDGSGTSGPSSTPGAGPAQRPTSAPTSRPRQTPSAPSNPGSTAGPTRTPTPVTRFGTWSGEAGSFTVSCTGTRPRFEGATPADGWRAERKDTSSETRVEFERGEQEVEVRARCSSSGPVFEVRSDGAGGDD